MMKISAYLVQFRLRSPDALCPLSPFFAKVQIA